MAARGRVAGAECGRAGRGGGPSELAQKVGDGGEHEGVVCASGGRWWRAGGDGADGTGEARGGLEERGGRWGIGFHHI